VLATASVNDTASLAQTAHLFYLCALALSIICILWLEIYLLHDLYLLANHKNGSLAGRL
jgi:hypothetical protein